MVSLTQRTWVWAISGSWWWTGKPGGLQFMGSQRVVQDWVIELNWMKSLIVLHMLKLTVLIVEKLVLRAIKFKVSKSGADDCNVTARISKASWQRPRCYRISKPNSWINSNYFWPRLTVNIKTSSKWTQGVEYFFTDGTLGRRQAILLKRPWLITTPFSFWSSPEEALQKYFMNNILGLLQVL